MNFFKLYIGDYQRDTAHLSIAEHGAYLLMLQHYYATERPLPTGKALHRMLRAQDKIERDAIDSVATRFWIQLDDCLINVRADVEIRKAEHQRTVNREIGKRGGRPKQSEHATEQITESVSCSVSESEPNDNPNQTPDTRLKKKPPKPPAAEAASSGKPDMAAELLDYLNAKAGKRFRPVQASLDPIRARLRQSTPDEIRAVIDDRVSAWGADAVMAKYLRPETLFRASKFEGYLGNLGGESGANGRLTPWAGAV